MALYLGLAMIHSSLFAAGPNIPGIYGKLALPAVAPKTLPQLRSITQGVSSVANSTDGGLAKLTIYQNQAKAVLDWDSFDIGSQAWVHFDQQGNRNWEALNRIWDANPSQIFGRLTGDGKVYLINQNGILFGPTSQLNIHSLIATSNNLTNSDFLNGLFNFKAENYNGRGDNLLYDPTNNVPGPVSNYGIITTDDEGSVFLVGPQVENGGTITTPSGQIGLVAGTNLALALATDASGNVYSYQTGPGGASESRTTRVVKMYESPAGSLAHNLEGGLLSADTGVVGMYGNIVNHEGIIRAVTAVERAGHVELLASDKILTGANSQILLPVSDSSDPVHKSFQTVQGTVVFSGLDANVPWSPQTYVDRIEHHGSIVAPSGYVSLNANKRVYLDSGSKIDVSGLWIDKPASANFLEVQMNTSNLRDEFIQKGGVLQGQTVTFTRTGGSNIGDVSGAFSNEGLTAFERHTTGGTVDINLVNQGTGATTGDAVVRQGAVIDLSGGGTNYAGGYGETTYLRSGSKLYSISSADPNLHYDQMVNLPTYVAAHKEGSDAGSLYIKARTVVLDGTLRGNVTKGIFQYKTAEPVNGTGNQSRAGYVEPKGGQIYIGGDTQMLNSANEPSPIDFFTQEIVVTPEASPLPSTFGAEDPLSSSTTYLSGRTLSDADLGFIYLATNTQLTLQPGAAVTVNPGGTFIARARRIEDYAAITALGGAIKLGIESNIKQDPSSTLEEKIYVGAGSSLIASGEKVNNMVLGNSPAAKVTSGHLDGGTIEVLDKTVTGQGVAVMPGALIDVSGGYQIDSASKITGGNAGTLSLQGSSLSVQGDLRGYSLAGKDGGAISLHASRVNVLSSASSSGDVGLLLNPDLLDPTGFTRITLSSVNDLNIGANVTIEPSSWKLATPLAALIGAMRPGNAGSASPSLIRVGQDLIGNSSVTLNAGKVPSNLTSTQGQTVPDWSMSLINANAKLSMAAGSVISTGPNGVISANAPSVDIAGTLNAPAGSISVISSVGGLVFETGGEALAEGYNERSTTAPVAGLTLDVTPLSGGTVTLNAASDLVLSEGSLVSVSGGVLVTRTVVGSDRKIATVLDGGASGSINLTATSNLTLNSLLEGQARASRLQGGTLSIEKKSASALSISQDELAQFKQNGFDALSLTNSADQGTLNLSGSGRVDFGRSLTLSAPVITGSGDLTLGAPWIQVTSAAQPSIVDPAAGTGKITLSGTWLDITGDVAFSGYSDVRLQALRDIRLTDALYKVGGSHKWSGQLRVPGDLTMEAARIYPTTSSLFTINAPNGKVTILPSGVYVADPIYSAGGSLTIRAAQGIEQRGYIAAPMGSIDLEATGANGRVYLADGSTTTTRGEVAVKYGDVQSSLGDNVWGVGDKNHPDVSAPYTAVTTAPDKSISISAAGSSADVIVSEGATLDISGGGSVFTYTFLPWTSGTTNPLAKAGVYVVVPGVTLPGNAVYLSGGNGLAAGVYSLLPSSYAFLPGAYVVTDLGTKVTAGSTQISKEGYTVVSGYRTVSGTGISSQVYTGYSVRSASDVLKEGNFEIQSIVAGDAGTLTARANTTVFNGVVQAGALSGYSGGAIALSGSNVTVQASAVPLPEGFGFTTRLQDVAPDVIGTLTVSASSLNNSGFKTIGLGFTNLDDPVNSITATSVTLKDGISLQAENVILAATDLITLEAGTAVLALSSSQGAGAASIITPNGKATINAGAQVHASNAVNLQVKNLDLAGILKSDHSELNLKGSKITVAVDGYNGTDGDGIFLKQSQWNDFTATFENIGLTSATDLIFKGAFADALSVKDTLTIDAGRIVGDAGGAVKIQAQTINLLNTGATNSSTGALGTGTITFESQEMSVGKGDVLFDSFSGVNLNAANDLTFKGVGNLRTGGVDLNIKAARVTTSYYMDAAGDPSLSPIYTPANFQVNAGSGSVNIGPGSGTAGTGVTPGGTLSVAGRAINVSTLIQSRSGQLNVSASDNISLSRGAMLDLQGTVCAPGGNVSMTSTNGGTINLDAGSLIDVSAGSHTDAGSVSIYAPGGGLTLNGSINGQAGAGGRGGSFSLVTSRIGDFGSLNTALNSGGFTETLNIRSMAGDIAIANQTVAGRNVKITADGGSLSLTSSTINVSQTSGNAGVAELYAKQNLTISGSSILAQGAATSAKGGEVTLGVDTGTLDFKSDSTINVAGAGSGAGGKTTFRGSLSGANYDQLNMALNGRVNGAAGIYVDAVRTYTNYATIDSAAISAIQSNTQAFMNSASASSLKNGFAAGLGLSPSQLHLRPNIVVASSGDLSLGTATLSQNWDLGSLHFSNEVGSLTLRAGGNLTLYGNITDAPTGSSGYSSLTSKTAKPSFSINLVAGAETTSADFMSVKPAVIQGATTGNISTGAGKVIYTETGDIRFASGGNTTINAGSSNNYMTASSMQYSLATYSGKVLGDVKGNLEVSPSATAQAAIQTTVGDISLQVGGDLSLDKSASGYLGAIRTTGESSTGSVSNYSTYAGGGNITLNVAGNVGGNLASSTGGLSQNWLSTYQDNAGFRTHKQVVANYVTNPSQSLFPTEGIAAMAGGDVYVRSGATFFSQIGTFGTGNLTVYSGGNLKGRFLVKKGTAILSSMGNFGSPSQKTLNTIKKQAQLIEAFDANINVSAQGNIEIGAILNPSLAWGDSTGGGRNWWDNTYTAASKVSLMAVTGDVNIYGSVDTSLYAGIPGYSYSSTSSRNLILPPSVHISAGRDINVYGPGAYVQVPTANGSLTFESGRDITFWNGATWSMSDADPVQAFTLQKSTQEDTNLTTHALYPVGPIHSADPNPVVINAGRDITDMSITLPKKAEITAGGDITDLMYAGQNIHDTDVTRISAGGDITYGYNANAVNEKIEIGGPGYLVVQAGGNIDLGNTKGISAVGNIENQALDNGGSIIVAAGYAGALAPGDVDTFFSDLRTVGADYADHLANGESAGAEQSLNDATNRIITPFYAEWNKGKNIAMTASQISTTGGGNLFLMATGDVNVGKTVLGSTEGKSTGIFTSTGGAIDVFAHGDVNVNESRIMTFMGGDITIWSDYGNINAGRGSKAVISMGKPVYTCDKTTGICSLKISPPTVGSGIRAMTYDPDQAGPLTAPPIGDLYIFAPRGVLDAGEAGISGGRGILAASQVINAMNMRFQVPPVGLPSSSSGISLGALSGSTTMSAATSVMQDSGFTNSAGKDAAKQAQPVEDAMKVVDVRVVSFDLDSPEASGGNPSR